MPECLIKAIPTHEGPREPYNWSGYALAEFATVSQGYTFSRDYQGKTDGRWQYFKVADIGLETNGKYLEKAINSIDDETIQLIGCRSFPKGSIVFPRVGAALLNNNKKVLAQDSIVDDNVLVLSIVNPDICDFEYLYYALQQVQLANWCNSSLVPVINSKTVLKHKIVLPPIEEQRRIAEILSTQDKIIDLYGRKIKGLQRFKKGVLSKMFPKPGHNTPEVRFPGFTDAWEQQKFKNTFDFLQNNTISRADLNSKNGIAKSVHYGDVLIKFGDYLDASSSALPYIPSQQIVNKFIDSLLQDGDVIMADTAEDEAVGKCTEIAGVQGFPTISGLHTIPLRPKKKFAPGYLGYYMNSGSYPADSGEQAKIGQFFIRLDNLITLHQRKRDEEIRKKKALMQLLLTGKVRMIV